MAAPQPSFRAEVPPPILQDDPKLSTQTAQYLRNFALWCRHGFADKLSQTVANPGIMLQASDAAAGTTPKVFLIQVNSAGTVTATQMPLGSGSP